MKYGLIGEHLSHSFSKVIHEKIGDYVYEIKELPPECVDDFMKERDFCAINVTIPYKETVMKHLDFIDESAKSIGAVNTVVNKNGKLYGYNTDYFGMKSLVNKANIDVEGRKVLIIGMGGTGKTAYTVVKDMGAKEIIFVTRSRYEGACSYDELYQSHTDVQVIFNTSPVGMYPLNDGTPVDLSRFPKLEGIIDVVYNPLKTDLVVEAQKIGIKAEGGLYMLVSQAIKAYEHFMDISANKSLCDTIFKDIITQKRNVVLTGMPSSGKTAVGRQLAKKTGKEFVDTDEEIVKRIGMDIPSYFKAYGEEQFREVECQVIKELSKKNSLIIATGGGAILNYNNVRRLKQNGVVFFLDRNLENLTPTEDRPLSSCKADLKKRYDERYPIYKSTADKTVDANKTVNEVADIIYGELIK